ncbi:MAG: nucleoside triphosphate pyrophosphohydrolase [Candidatus Omnitrophica bacterium]|nr:nucleoside triphosphate pyrophosphohydrolase [Candidatus Omnitrophota bacterium]
MSGKLFTKLVKLMARLRAKDGCPWDKSQTHSSLKKYLIEEAYEVCEVIEAKNSERLKDELGDLLFQAIFHAQIAKERQAFDINDVLRASYRKMLRRHHHVFGKHKAKGPDEAYKRWQERKNMENDYDKERSLLSGVPPALPALLKAQKVSKRASWVGFDWPNINGVVKKIEEELREIKEEIKHKNKRKFGEEIGDLLFALVNLARFMDIDAEEALNSATKKFVKRFKKLEKALKKQNKKITECGLKKLDQLWELYKKKK